MSGCQTWDSIEEMRRGMMLMLQGSPYFAWQYTFTDSTGEPDQAYRPCRHLNQLTQFEAEIFEGRKTVGFYAIRPDNRTRWGGQDFDNHDGSKSRGYWLPHAQSAFEALKNRFPEVWLVETPPGGFHVTAFADALLPAAEMRSILKPLAPEGVEIFPKQDELDASKPNAKGSLLRFPGRHQLKGTWARIIARAGRIQDADGIAAAPMPGKYEVQSRGAQFHSLYAQVTRAIRITGAGQRFNPMQQIVGRLKGRTLDEEVARQIHDRFYNQHRVQVKTPIDKSRACFMTWFRKADPCNVEIPDYPPTPAQQAMIDALPVLPDTLPERLADTVRYFLSAKHYADEKGRDFCMSLPKLAAHLGVASNATASKYRDACYKVGLIKMVKRGSYVTGLASTYKLLGKWDR